MDELNKNQIVLLTLLVSFVTSIATGIVTVTLLDQAPAGVTQTINRIVERTIETTIPGEPTVTTVIKEVPVPITEEEIIVDLIHAASPGVVEVIKGEESVGSGFIASADGLIVTSRRLVATEDSANYQVVLANGAVLSAQVLNSSLDHGVAVLQADLAGAADITKVVGVSGDTVTPPVVLSLSDEEMVPGQSVVAIGRPDQGPINVATSIVSGVFTNASSTVLINTNAANVNNLGGPLLNTKGRVVAASDEPGLGIVAAEITATIAGIIR